MQALACPDLIMASHQHPSSVDLALNATTRETVVRLATAAGCRRPGHGMKDCDELQQYRETSRGDMLEQHW